MAPGSFTAGNMNSGSYLGSSNVTVTTALPVIRGSPSTGDSSASPDFTFSSHDRIVPLIRSITIFSSSSPTLSS